MPAIAVNPPFPLFTDADGAPLDDAYIYIGTANQNPVSNPITVYWDSALTITASQPIRTSGGYPVYNGSPARFYTNSDYSILLRDKNGAFIYTAASETDFISSEFVTFIQAGTGAVATTVQAKLRETVSVLDFGAVGDGVADDTVAVQSAITYCLANQKKLYASSGQYRCTANIQYGAGFVMFGDGPANTFFIKDFTGSSGKGLFWCDSGSAAVVIDGPEFSDFTVDGKVETFGFVEPCHLISMSGVKNARMYNVHLVGNTGDGLYIGSGVIGGVERHNANIVIDSCVFNGRVNNGRNGISVIDCDGILITGCYFTKTSKAGTPGGIDFERNAVFNIHRNAKIIGCKFVDIFQTNTCGVMISIDQEATASGFVADFVIDGCSFDTVYYGVNTLGDLSVRNQSYYPDSVIVRNSYFIDCFENVNISGTGVLVDGNSFVARTPSVTKRNRVSVGRFESPRFRAANDVKITNNYFKYANSTGAIEVHDVEGCSISGNIFDACQTVCVYFYNVIGATLSGINVMNNRVKNVEKQLGGANTVYFFNAQSGINSTGNNILINSTCSYSNNTLENNIATFPGGWTVLMRGMPTGATAPTTGTWNAGDSLPRNSSISAGTFLHVCSVSGTFGTLGASTADATTGSATLLNVSDVSALRPGQYILVSGDAAPKQITAINGSTVYMNANYTGTTGTGLALSWSAATFVSA